MYICACSCHRRHARISDPLPVIRVPTRRRYGSVTGVHAQPTAAHRGGHTQERSPPDEEQVHTPESCASTNALMCMFASDLLFACCREAARECRKKERICEVLENRVAVLENQIRLLEELKLLRHLLPQTRITLTNTAQGLCDSHTTCLFSSVASPGF